jgi:hypothetical protein
MLLPELVIQSDNPYDDESSHGSADMEFVSSSDLDGESVALTTKCDLDEYLVSCR